MNAITPGLLFQILSGTLPGLDLNMKEPKIHFFVSLVYSQSHFNESYC